MQVNLHAETIQRIADGHIEMYGKRLESKHPIVRVDETTAYLEIWKSIKAKCAVALGNGQDSVALSNQELGEVVDAIDTGEWDDIMPKETSEQAT
jgi:hypothetical protein